MISQVLEWSLSGHDGLDKESEHGEHSETSVLDLLDLELGKGVWIVSKTQWVEGLSWVEWVESLSSWSSVHAVSLNESHEQHLGEGHGDDGLGVDEGWVSEVVESVLSEDGGSGLEPHSGVSKVNGSVAGEELWGDASEGSQHGPAGVDHLALSVAGKGLWVSRETGGIPSVISWVLSGEVGNLWGEWSEELGSVWAIELNGSASHLASSLQIRREKRVIQSLVKRVKARRPRSIRSRGNRTISQTETLEIEENRDIMLSATLKGQRYQHHTGNISRTLPAVETLALSMAEDLIIADCIFEMIGIENIQRDLIIGFGSAIARISLGF